MTSRREISRRIVSLDEIAGIVSAMKALALMETHRLQAFVATQEHRVAGIEEAGAEFLAWHPQLRELHAPAREICVMVGAEQGFCGDFNDALAAQYQKLGLPQRRSVQCVTIGRRLGNRLPVGQPVLKLPGASVADEVPAVLLRLTQELNELISADPMTVCVSALYHCDATGEIRLQPLLPLGDLPAPGWGLRFPPELNVPPDVFFSGLVRHYLDAALNGILYSSLLAENRARQLHMDSALNKLDENREQLRRAYDARRQEDITEEIEIILLSAGLMRDFDPTRELRASPAD